MDLAERLANLRDLLAQREADRLAAMPPLERVVHEHLAAEHQRRMDALLEELLYGR